MPSPSRVSRCKPGAAGLTAVDTCRGLIRMMLWDAATASQREPIWHPMRPAATRSAPHHLLAVTGPTTGTPLYPGMPVGSIGPTRGRCLKHLRRVMGGI